MARDLESADEINRQVERFLRAADAFGRFPTPVDDIVRTAQLVEADDYVFDESLIRAAPLAMRRLLRSARSKIQGLVDRRARVIHVAPAIENDGKRRFVKLHETVHHVLPHQAAMLYADDHETLSPNTNVLFEREANQGAAELLFQRDQFAKDAADLEISVASVWHLRERYGSSFHAALRRYAEKHPDAVAAIVLDPTPLTQSPPTWRRHEFMATARWAKRFGEPRWPVRMTALAYPFLTALDHSRLDAVTLCDIDGKPCTVHVDKCVTPYASFILLWEAPVRRLRRLQQVELVSG